MKPKMSNEDFLKIKENLRKSIQKYPNCRIANCECNSYKEWEEGCFCMCHFFYMDEKFGKDKWNLNDFSKIARVKEKIKPRGVAE